MMGKQVVSSEKMRNQREPEGSSHQNHKIPAETKKVTTQMVIL